MSVHYLMLNKSTERSLRVLTDRTQRLKDARSQATKEIEDYRTAKELEFKAFEASVCAPADEQPSSH